MGRIKEPSGGAIRGKVLNALRLAGRYGCTAGKVQKDHAIRKINAVHSAVHGLRKMGYRIDFDGRRYSLKGEGLSFTQMRRGCKPMPVAVTRRTVACTKVVPIQPRAPQALSRRIAVGKDVFLVNPGVLQRALKVLPESARTGILEVTRKARQYNKAVRLFASAQGMLEIGQ